MRCPVQLSRSDFKNSLVKARVKRPLRGNFFKSFNCRSLNFCARRDRLISSVINLIAVRWMSLWKGVSEKISQMSASSKSSDVYTPSTHLLDGAGELPPPLSLQPIL